MSSVVDQFHRSVLERIDEQRRRQVASALAIDGTNDEIANRFMYLRGYIKALDDIVEICREVQRKLYGGDGED